MKLSETSLDSIYQYILNDKKNKKKYFYLFPVELLITLHIPFFISYVGIYMINTQSVNLSPLYLVLAIFVYIYLWVRYSIFGYLEYFIARIASIPGVEAVTEESLLQRYMEIDSLMLTAKLSKRKKGFVIYDLGKCNNEATKEIKRYETVTILKIKLNKKKKQVLFQEVVKKNVKSTRLGNLCTSIEIFSTIDLKGWQRNVTPPYDIMEGIIKRKSNIKEGIDFNIKNLLIELCLLSGWEWKPVLLLWLKKD